MVNYRMATTMNNLICPEPLKPGSIVEIETRLDEILVGEVHAFDYELRLLILSKLFTNYLV